MREYDTYPTSNTRDLSRELDSSAVLLSFEPFMGRERVRIRVPKPLDSIARTSYRREF